MVEVDFLGKSNQCRGWSRIHSAFETRRQGALIGVQNLLVIDAVLDLKEIRDRKIHQGHTLNLMR